MTDASMAGRFAESDFRVGKVINRSVAVLSRNLLPFFIVTAIATCRSSLLVKGAGGSTEREDATANPWA